MRGIRIFSFAVAFLAFGFLLLAMPEEGFSGFSTEMDCCQLEGQCFDTSEGPIKCLSEDLVENAFCNEDNDLCTQIIPERNIPTLSQWSLIALAVILAIAGYIIIRRRKAAA